MYGWDFSAGEVTATPSEADIIPVAMEAGRRDSVVVRASGEGGILFVPRSELGVDAQFLAFSDEAPVDGYKETGVLDFTSEGGVYFVRTRDGAHYAKFSFVPTTFGQTLGPDVARDLSLPFVFHPGGSRNLFYQTIE